MTELVAALSGPREKAIIFDGLAWVAGYVVGGADIPDGATVPDLHARLGLGFPGSPFAPDAEFLDLIRLPATPFLNALVPLGGPSREIAEASGGSFIDHAPFRGDGFVGGVDAFVAQWWIDPTRLPAGATLWRHFADGRRVIIAGYANIAVDWVALAEGVEIPATPLRNPEVLGVFAEIAGEKFLADLLPTGSVIVCSPMQQPGMEQSARGIWWREVQRSAVDRLYGVRVVASWNRLPMQIVGFDAGPEGPVAHAVFIGHDALAAEAAGLAKTGAGLYEAVVPASELVDLRELQTETALPARES